MMPFGWSSSNDAYKTYTGIIDQLCLMGEAYYYFGKLNDAIRHLKASQQFIEQFTEEEIQPIDRLRVAVKLCKMLCASILYQGIHLDTVLPTLLSTRQRVEADIGEGNDAQYLSDILDLTGLAYYYHKLNTGEGSSSASLAYFQQALELRQQLTDTLGESESFFHIGLIYENGDEPDNDKALFYYSQAYQLAKENFHELEQSYAARHLGSIAETQGNHEQARRYFEESLALREKIGFKITLPFSYLAVGDVCFVQEEWNAAAKHYQNALMLSRELNMPTTLLVSLLSMGDLYQTQDNKAKALECFEEALAIAKAQDAAYWVSEATSRIDSLASK